MNLHMAKYSPTKGSSYIPLQNPERIHHYECFTNELTLMASSFLLPLIKSVSLSDRMRSPLMSLDMTRRKYSPAISSRRPIPPMSTCFCTRVELSTITASSRTSINSYPPSLNIMVKCISAIIACMVLCAKIFSMNIYPTASASARWSAC